MQSGPAVCWHGNRSYTWPGKVFRGAKLSLQMLWNKFALARVSLHQFSNLHQAAATVWSCDHRWRSLYWSEIPIWGFHVSTAGAGAVDAEILSWVKGLCRAPGGILGCYICALDARSLDSLCRWGFLDEKKGCSGVAHTLQTHAGRALAALGGWPLPTQEQFAEVAGTLHAGDGSVKAHETFVWGLAEE